MPDPACWAAGSTNSLNTGRVAAAAAAGVVDDDVTGERDGVVAGAAAVAGDFLSNVSSSEPSGSSGGRANGFG